MRGAAFAEPDRDDRRRHDRDAARDQPARPRRQADVEKAFHHDLAGERRGDGRVQAAAQQRDAEQRRRNRRAKQRREERMRLLEFGDVGLAGLVEGRGRENKDRRR